VYSVRREDGEGEECREELHDLSMVVGK